MLIELKRRVRSFDAKVMRALTTDRDNLALIRAAQKNITQSEDLKVLLGSVYDYDRTTLVNVGRLPNISGPREYIFRAYTFMKRSAKPVVRRSIKLARRVKGLLS